jgi:CheY-like chemotaxis protein
VTAPLLLVVEDDAEVREAISDVLRDAGYRISAAGDGAAAACFPKPSPVDDLLATVSRVARPIS